MPAMTDRSADDAPAEDHDTVDAVVQLSFSIQALLGEIAAEHELSMTQFRLLAILRDREPAMLDLARHLNLEKSSVTGLIDRAQRRGLVERAPAPHDGRGIHVRLTAEGRRLTEQVAPQAYEALSRLLDALPARDRARLSTLAGTVVRHHAARLASISTPCAPAAASVRWSQPGSNRRPPGPNADALGRASGAIGRYEPQRKRPAGRLFGDGRPQGLVQGPRAAVRNRD